MMSENAHEELYRVLLDTAHEAPVEVVANCIEVLSVVLNKRLHDDIEIAGSIGPI